MIVFILGFVAGALFVVGWFAGSIYKNARRREKRAVEWQKKKRELDKELGDEYGV